jgi:hypothetical protein
MSTINMNIFSRQSEDFITQDKEETSSIYSISTADSQRFVAK